MVEAKWVSIDKMRVDKLAKRSGRILLTLLEELKNASGDHSVPKHLYDESVSFVTGVLDGSHSVPSDVVVRHRYSDDDSAMAPFPLLKEAFSVFSIAIHKVQPENWPEVVAQLEADFASRMASGRAP